MRENSYEFSTKHCNLYIKFSPTRSCIITRRKFWEGPCNLDYTVALEKTFRSLLLTTYRATSQPLFNFATTTARSLALLRGGPNSLQGFGASKYPDDIMKILIFFFTKENNIIPSLKSNYILFISYC